MDDEQEVVIVGADGTEHVFPGGFDPQRAAAIVRGDEQSTSAAPQASRGSATPAVLAGIGMAKAGPAIMAGVSKGARAFSALDPLVTSIAGGAMSGGTGSAMGAAAPKVAGIIAKATQPAGQAIKTGSQFLKATTKAGPVMRLAGGLSKVATKAAPPLVALSALFDIYQAGQAVKPGEPAVGSLDIEVLRRQLGGVR